MSRQIILNFHGVGEPPVAIDADERPYWVPVETFEALVARTAGRPEVAYTFDDGNRSDLDICMPILQRHGRTGGFYILTGRLDREGYLGPADVRALLAGGMSVGLHGRDHVDWRTLDDATLMAETHEARTRLADVAGSNIDVVSIPFGAYNKRVLGRLFEEGFSTILTTDGGAADDGQPIRTRTSIRCDMSAGELDDIVAGRLSPKAQARRALAGFLKRHVV